MRRMHLGNGRMAVGEAHGLTCAGGLPTLPQGRGAEEIGQGEAAVEASEGLSPASLSLPVCLLQVSLLIALPLAWSPSPFFPLPSLRHRSQPPVLLPPSSACQPQGTQVSLSWAEKFSWAQTWSGATPARSAQERVGTVYAGVPSGSSPGVSEPHAFVLPPPPPPFSLHLPSSSCFHLSLPVTPCLPQSLSGPGKVINRPASLFLGPQVNVPRPAPCQSTRRPSHGGAHRTG